MPNSRNSPGTPRPSPVSAASARVDQVCRRIADGRIAARELAAWVASAGVSEAEFRLLWTLFHGDLSLNQAELASRLAVSPAQVSGAVERLQSLGLIHGSSDAADRRRQLWRLAPAGSALIRAVLAQVAAAATKEAA
jgi:DNA-binding MarR family transcriptional regulator